MKNAGVGPVIDPQVGWEQQKFAMMFTMLHLPENGRTQWTDMMRVYQLGADSDPGFENRIEFHDPNGDTWIARTYGTETLFGKPVQKGIAARVLEYANSLLPTAIDVNTVVGKSATWYTPKLDATGKVVYKTANAAGALVTVPSCDNSKDCTKVKNYVSVPKFLREAGMWFGRTPHVGQLKGVY